MRLETIADIAKAHYPNNRVFYSYNDLVGFRVHGIMAWWKYYPDKGYALCGYTSGRGAHATKCSING